MLLRTLGVISFIAIAGGAGIYFAQRPTIARGDVLAAELIQANEHVKAMTCDQHIRIGIKGATFHCAIELKSGAVGRVRFIYDRNGSITEAPIDVEKALPTPAVEKTGDPWAD